MELIYTLHMRNTVLIRYNSAKNIAKVKKVRSRLPGGILYENILMCFYKFRKHPCVHNCKAILYAVSNYFLGRRITNLFGKQSEDNRIECVFYPMK